jgi:hypothetical protein
VQSYNCNVKGSKMKDFYLEFQPLWRYCRVRDSEKKPYPSNWQNMPLTLEQVDSKNIGLILGPKGNGVCAIDFDGTTAWSWAEENGIDRSTLTSVAWSSGKTDRCQMAFTVPEEYWPYLKTKKIPTKQPSKPGAGDGEGFEFRWDGGQSVLPPSIHPDTKQPYHWLIDASNQMQIIPDCVLMAWLECLIKETPKALDLTPEVHIDDLTDADFNEVDHALRLLKNKYPTLMYDDWFNISSAVAHHLGRPVAQMLMQKYYPEQKSGEYNNLFRSWNKAKSHTIGTLIVMAGVKKTLSNTGPQAAQRFLKEQNRFKGLL